jgi:hypothetical protein
MRKNRRTEQALRPINLEAALGSLRIETKRGKRYQVRKTFDGSSVYKCPGCNNGITQGATSLTVIEQDHIFGEQAAIDERRHWHESCWKGYS